MNNIIISKDWEWYLAEIKWYKNLYAFWNTKQEAKEELLWVLEMMMDYNLELVEKSRKLKNKLLNYAI